MAEVMAIFASKVLTTIGNFRICSIVVGMIIQMPEKSFNFVVGASLVKQVAKATNDVAGDGMLLRFRWKKILFCVFRSLHGNSTERFWC
nr:hypothetical protein [Tanacetum cinerariifolium]